MRYNALIMFLWLFFAGLSLPLGYFINPKLGIIFICVGAACIVIGFGISLLSMIFGFELPGDD